MELTELTLLGVPIVKLALWGGGLWIAGWVVVVVIQDNLTQWRKRR